MRVSWILMPGWRTEPMVTGSAIRCSSGKSVWTLSHWAWKLANRLMMVLNLWRTSSR